MKDNAASRKAAKFKGKGTFNRPEEIRYTKCAFCGDNLDNITLFNPAIVTLHPTCWRHIEKILLTHNKECLDAY